MSKASLLQQGQVPTYQNLSPFAQEISSGEMSEVTQKSDIHSCQMRLLGGTPHMYNQVALTFEIGEMNYFSDL